MRENVQGYQLDACYLWSGTFIIICFLIRSLDSERDKLEGERERLCVCVGGGGYISYPQIPPSSAASNLTTVITLWYSILTLHHNFAGGGVVKITRSTHAPE